MAEIFYDLLRGFNHLLSIYDPLCRQNKVSFDSGEPKVDVLLIAGGSASGTTTLGRSLMGRINQEYAGDFDQDLVALVNMDDFYVNRDPAELSTPDYLVDHDHPDMVEIPLLVEQLSALQRGETVEMPIYNWGGLDVAAYRESDKTNLFAPRPLVIVEGLFALDERLRDLAHRKVFVYADEAIALDRRRFRDQRERSCRKREVDIKWNLTVQKNYEKFVLPTMEQADVLVFNNGVITNEFFIY